MNVDPRILVQLIKTGRNPQQLMMSVLQGQAGNPLTNNLLSLARQGNGAEIERIVRNLYTEQGGTNFDQDFNSFKQSLGL